MLDLVKDQTIHSKNSDTYMYTFFLPNILYLKNYVPTIIPKNGPGHTWDSAAWLKQ